MTNILLPWMLVVLFSWTPVDGEEKIFRSFIPMESKLECIQEEEKMQSFRVETPVGIIEFTVECYPSVEAPGFDLKDLDLFKMKEV